MIWIPYKLLLTALAALALGGCSEPTQHDTATQQSAGPQIKQPKLGLMTSLPLYWPLDADFGDLAQGNGEKPWQRAVIEQQFELVPLDTLSPIPGLSVDDPEIDPLAGLDRIAVIQPRGLSAADNVALDEWVRAGGELLLVLDPMLTGDYDIPVGDPRRPIDTALIPPVVKRWGVTISFDQTQGVGERVSLGDFWLRVLLTGEVKPLSGAERRCELVAGNVIARCQVEEGRVTVFADANVFEEQIISERRDNGADLPLAKLMRFAFP